MLLRRMAVRGWLTVAGIGLLLVGGLPALRAQNLAAVDMGAATVDVARHVDTIFQAWRTTASPGCAVGVTVGSATVLSRAYGMADLEQDRPNTVETVFEAGSVSKQFTAAAVLILAQEGKLSLDDSVRTYVPEVPDYGTPMTIRHLLTHTSGLRDWGSIAALAGWPRTSRVHTHAHVLDLVSRQKVLNFEPGSQYSYSNTGYNLAAIIVARVSGQSFAEFTRARLFEPLGMKRTEWRDDYRRIVRRRATAYAPTGQGGWRQDMPFENVHGNGGLLTTVEDLLRWNRNFVHAKVGGRRLIAEQVRQGRLNDGREIAYAAGLRTSTWRGVREIGHSGSTAGYSAYLTRFPDQDVSVAVLCNAAHADAAAYAHQVAQLYLGDALAAWRRPTLAAVPRATLEAQAGVFRDVRTGAARRLLMDEGKLRFENGSPLLPLSSTSFLMGNSAVRVEFETDAAGSVLAVREEWPSGEIERYERQRASAPTSEALAEFAGRYTSEEAETEFLASVEEGHLVLRQRPDRVFALVPAWADSFSAPFGTVVFRRDAGGRVNALSVTVPRVYDLRFARVTTSLAAGRP